jgi:hypothetical protein
VPAVRNFGLKEVSRNQMDLQVVFYPFRGPEASRTLFQAYHTAREVLLSPGREAWIDWHSSGLTGKQEVIRPERKLVLPFCQRWTGIIGEIKVPPPQTLPVKW